MRWNQGREIVGRMLDDREVQRVPANREHADRLIEQARKHLASADAVCDVDPNGGYALVYDAARKALTAVLENEGLRPTTRGGHLAVYEAVRAQLDPPLGATLRPFDRMRRQRHDAEYPKTDFTLRSPRFVTHRDQYAGDRFTAMRLSRSLPGPPLGRHAAAQRGYGRSPAQGKTRSPALTARRPI